MTPRGSPFPLGRDPVCTSWVGQYLSFSLQLFMVLVTGVSWDLSSPESNSNYGVGDAHNEQWETVHQDDDNDVVPAEKDTHTHAEDSFGMRHMGL